MIRSGLVNRREGGGFEEGFPHKRDARDVYDIRPYVDSMDTGFKKASDFSIIIPKAVSYAHIFSKKLTPGEKVFLAKQLKRGIKRAQRNRKVYTGVNDELEESKPLPDTPEIEVEEEPPREPTFSQRLSGVDESGHDQTWEDEYELRDALYKEELEAVDIVYPMIHQETFDEQEEAEMKWEGGELDDVVMDRKNHSRDDIAVTTENNFGGQVKLNNRQRTAKSQVSKKTKDTNGVGPRKRI